MGCWKIGFVSGPGIALNTAAGQAVTPFNGATGSVDIAASNKAAPDFRAMGRKALRHGGTDAGAGACDQNYLVLEIGNHLWFESAGSGFVSALGGVQPPLTPPAVKPPTMSFWITTVSTITGNITTIAAAASGPQETCSNVSML